MDKVKGEPIFLAGKDTSQRPFSFVLTSLSWSANFILTLVSGELNPQNRIGLFR
jgi:hypothetical protein